MNIDVEDYVGYSLVGAVIAAILAGVLWGVVALVKTTTADGGVDFCLVEYQPPLYRVMTHKPWRSDGTLALTQTFEEAVRAADAVKCPIAKP